MEKYIVVKRFKDTAICGPVNLAYGIEVVRKDSYLYSIDNKQLCAYQSQNAYDYFVGNDDGKGLERGKLIQEIKYLLQKPSTKHQKRWNKLWGANEVYKYRRNDYEDYWLWNSDFYTAPIEDLQHIKDLITI